MTTIKHGMYGTQFYHTYYRIKARCENPNYPEFHLYGGRGIKKIWCSFEDFYNEMYESFIEHLAFNQKTGISIDRINVNGNYCKENCRWATASEQSRNRRSNILIKYNNKTQCLRDWAKELNFPEVCLRKRLHKGWSFEKAIAIPSRRINK